MYILLLLIVYNVVAELKQDVDVYGLMSSWCKKPLTFGRGTPVWIASASHAIFDITAVLVLMDSKDGEGV